MEESHESNAQTVRNGRRVCHGRELILPVLCSYNYISLMPGEQRTISMELNHADTRSEKPAVIIEGFNINR